MIAMREMDDVGRVYPPLGGRQQGVYRNIIWTPTYSQITLFTHRNTRKYFIRLGTQSLKS